MGCIYLYTNKINGKQYIGQTIQPIQVRHYNHLHQNTYFDRALKKYGESNFTLEILEDNIFDSEELDKKEQYYIEKYNTYYDGYNSTPGGDGRIISKLEDEQELLRMAKEGYKAQELAEIFNVCKMTIFRTLHKLNFYYHIN